MSLRSAASIRRTEGKKPAWGNAGKTGGEERKGAQEPKERERVVGMDNQRKDGEENQKAGYELGKAVRAVRGYREAELA